MRSARKRRSGGPRMSLGKLNLGRLLFSVVAIALIAIVAATVAVFAHPTGSAYAADLHYAELGTTQLGSADLIVSGADHIPRATSPAALVTSSNSDQLTLKTAALGTNTTMSRAVAVQDSINPSAVTGPMFNIQAMVTTNGVLLLLIALAAIVAGTMTSGWVLLPQIGGYLSMRRPWVLAAAVPITVAGGFWTGLTAIAIFEVVVAELVLMLGVVAAVTVAGARPATRRS